MKIFQIVTLMTVVLVQSESHTFVSVVPTSSDGMVAARSSVAIQANDYEIERHSGLLPARRRIIPVKFR